MITLADLKTYLNITVGTYDSFLNDAIEKQTAVISTLTNRKLQKQTNTEYYIGSGEDTMFLNNWPVESLTSIKVYNKHGNYTYDDLFESPDTVGNSTLINNLEGKVVLKKGYAFTKVKIIELIYTAGYNHDQIGIYFTPEDLQAALIQLCAEYFIGSRQGDSTLTKEAINVGGSATSGIKYKKVDVSHIINKYRKTNI